MQFVGMTTHQEVKDHMEQLVGVTSPSRLRTARKRPAFTDRIAQTGTDWVICQQDNHLNHSKHQRSCETGPVKSPTGSHSNISERSGTSWVLRESVGKNVRSSQTRSVRVVTVTWFKDNRGSNEETCIRQPFPVALMFRKEMATSEEEE